MPINTYPQQIQQSQGSLLAYQEAVAQQGSITTEVDLTGLTATVIVPAGRRIKITAHCLFFSSVSSDIGRLSIKEGATLLQLAQDSVAAVSNGISLNAIAVITPSAGAHTYKLTMQRVVGTGTLTMDAGTVYPAFIMVEDVTGFANPYGGQAVPVGQLGSAQNFAHGQITTTQWTDLTGSGVNVVVPAGRTVRITGHVHLSSSIAGDRLVLGIREGTTVLGESYMLMPTANIGQDMFVQTTISPAAGAHTYVLSAGRQSGTGVVTVYSQPNDSFSYLVVEDITATPAPANSAPSSTLAYAEVRAAQSGITTNVDLAGLSVTVTVPAGRRLRISTYLQPYSTVANDTFNAQIYQDGVQLQEGLVGLPVTLTGFSLDVSVEVSPAAGSHTYKVMGRRNNGSGSLTAWASATAPMFILVEDITGVSLGGLIDTTPIATVAMTAAAVAPSGWMLCDGTALSRATYGTLFALIGTTYGAGDGSTTFNLPNLKGRVPVGRDAAQTEFDVLGETGGEKTHVLTIAELAAHNHSYSNAWTNAPADGGSDINRYHVAVGVAADHGLGTANNGSGTAHNNLQPYIAMNYMIKVM